VWFAGAVPAVHIDQLAVMALAVRIDGPVALELERAALRVQNRATQLCPVDTGRLRASIDHEMGVDAEGAYALVGSNVEYAGYVEFGTRFMAPQPYLRPALAAAAG
jgi:HK97 gp10 family phage protein